MRTIGTLLPSGTTGRVSLKPEVQTPQATLEAIARALFPSPRVAPRVMWSALRLVTKVSAEGAEGESGESEGEGGGGEGEGEGDGGGGAATHGEGAGGAGVEVWEEPPEAATTRGYMGAPDDPEWALPLAPPGRTAVAAAATEAAAMASVTEPGQLQLD